MKKIVLATNNPGKVAEFEALMKPVKCVTQSSLQIESVAETGLTFVENALIKARHVSLISGKPALADDSGLVVSALGGEPGLYSSRFAGEGANDSQNMDLLLSKLSNIPLSKRDAYFYCVIVLLQHANDPSPIIAVGRWDGFISQTRNGSEGFGYDPIFYVPSHQCTAAQLPKDIKNKISHRAQAFTELKRQLNMDG